MLAWLFTTLLNAVRSVARAVGLELEVVLTEHKIKTKMQNPDKTDKFWNSKIWTNGNIYLKDYANPVNIEISDIENHSHKEDDSVDADLITTERYKTFMEQSLIDDMLQASKDNDLTLKTAVIAIIATNLLTLGIVYVASSGMI